MRIALISLSDEGAQVIGRLQAGEWAVGDRFPVVDELLKSYEYSRVTVFKGVQRLVEEKILVCGCNKK